MDAEAEAPILWSPDAKSQLTGKDSDAGKDWKQEEKGATEDEMVGWHHWLNGHKSVLTKLWEIVKDREAMLWSMGSQRVRHDLATEGQQYSPVNNEIFHSELMLGLEKRLSIPCQNCVSVSVKDLCIPSDLIKVILPGEGHLATSWPPGCLYWGHNFPTQETGEID